MTNLTKCFSSASFFLSIFVECWNCEIGFRVGHNSFIGLTMSDLSTQNCVALSDKHHTLFKIKYINNSLQISNSAFGYCFYRFKKKTDSNF